MSKHTLTDAEQNKVLQEYAAYEKLLAEKGKEAIRLLFVRFFEKFPEISKVRWDQYTPYFNDGEPCEFQVEAPYPLDADGNDIYSWNQDGKKYAMLSSAFERLDASIFLRAFGDHARVVVMREVEGPVFVVTEDTEHD